MLFLVASTTTSPQIVTSKTRASGTTVAMKILMAVTGLFFVFYLVLHMYGNLKLFFGMEAYNHYAEYLREFLYPILPERGVLWILRVMLAFSIGVHVYSAVSLWARARRARGGVGYAAKRSIATGYAVRTMRWGGIIILAFVVFHLAHFTWLAIEIGGDYQTLSPAERMVASFENWWLVVLYGISVALVAMHIRHGVWSSMATLGASKKRREFAINAVAIAIALAIFIGFMLPPVAILAGILPY